MCSKSKVITEFNKKEKKLKISGRDAAVEETKASAEKLRRTLVTSNYEVHRPGERCVTCSLTSSLLSI